MPASPAPASPPPACGALLSVIVPVCNVEPWMRVCLDSLCHQTYRSLEIICVDDGSTDSSLSILREYEARDSRIKVLHKPNGGLSSARNMGLEHATGEWVTFPDPDDWLFPHAYSTAMAHTDEVDVVKFGIRIVVGDMDIDGEALQKKFDFPEQGRYRLVDTGVCKVPEMVNDRIFRRCIIEQHGLRFHGDLKPAEDTAFYREFSLVAGAVHYLPEYLYCYFQRSSSIMNSEDWSKRMLPNVLRMHDYLADALARPELRPEHYELYASWLHREYWSMVEKNAAFMAESEVRELFCQLARRHRLWQYPPLRPMVGELGAEPAWWAIFVSYRMETTTWRLFGIPLLKWTRRGGVVKCRLLGMTIWKVCHH